MSDDTRAKYDRLRHAAHAVIFLAEHAHHVYAWPLEGPGSHREMSDKAWAELVDAAGEDPAFNGPMPEPAPALNALDLTVPF